MLPTPPHPAHGRGCFPMRGKYWDEMHDAVLHWRYLQCAAPRYWRLPPKLSALYGWPPRLMLVVAAGRRFVEPIGMAKAVDRGYTTRHVLFDHATTPRAVDKASRARGACPVSLAPHRPAERVPLSGFCRGTDGEGDCARGDDGAWDIRKHRIRSLHACAAKCRACARCNLVSFSRLHHDCSWFHYCHRDVRSHKALPPELFEEQRLTNVESGWDYVTLRVFEHGRAAAQTTTRGRISTQIRREFPGAVSASGVVELH